jgi:hypothetical protein
VQCPGSAPADRRLAGVRAEGVEVNEYLLALGKNEIIAQRGVEPHRLWLNLTILHQDVVIVRHGGRPAAFRPEEHWDHGSFDADQVRAAVVPHLGRGKLARAPEARSLRDHGVGDRPLR